MAIGAEIRIGGTKFIGLMHYDSESSHTMVTNWILETAHLAKVRGDRTDTLFSIQTVELSTVGVSEDNIGEWRKVIS